MEINLREVKESFIATTRDLLQKSEALLLEMERSSDPNYYTEILRAIHTIKGNAGIFELESLIELCHAFETCLEAARDKGGTLPTTTIDIGLTVIDRMRIIVANIDNAPRLAEIKVDDLIDQLHNREAQPQVAAEAVPVAAEKSGFDRLRETTQKIKLPEKYLTQAKKDNRYLIFVVIDFADQGDMSLSQFYSKLHAMHKSNTLLSLGVLRKETSTHGPNGPFLPYFMILSSGKKAEEIAQELSLRFLLFHYFWQPEATPKTAAVPADASRDHHVKETHLKVHLDLLNTLIDITGEIVLTRNALVRKVDEQADQSLASFTKKLSYLVTDLQDKVMKTRLQSLEVLFHRFPRLVRETAQQTSKKAELRIEGADIEIDKAIIDEIADPLVHIIRNAVDHGLETPAERTQAGKSETGNIVLQAQAREGNIVIRIVDDGRGLDLDRIKNTAVNRGLITREQANAAAENEIAEYLFMPGFSTKQEVTTISGRGVGMDVVRTNISKLGGSVDIVGESGKGSIVTMVIPQTLSILTCLPVEVNGFRFVIPQQNIVEVVTIDNSKLQNIQNKLAYELRSRLLPLVEANELLEIPNAAEGSPFIVVVRTEKYYFGLRIETILDTEEVVVKPLPQFGQERQIFSGAAIMGDGRIAPILDAALIGKHANLQANADAINIARSTKVIGAVSVQYLLFRAQSRNIAFRVASLPRIEPIEISDIETIVDRQVVHYRDEIIPILSTEFLRNTEIAPDKPRNMIILQNGERRYGLLTTEILDIIEDTIEVRRESRDRAEIEGYALIKNETAIILNLSQLMRAALETTSLPVGQS
jgi:two-component system, chemotaxis family, sensor kinase CheA